MKPHNWGVSDVMEWDFLTVKETQQDLANTIDYQKIIEIITRLTGYPQEKILNKLWFDVFHFIKFVQESIERINEVELKLAVEPDADEQAAGIEMYNQFGFFVTVDRLAGGDPLKYEAVGALPYSVVFSKLLLNLTDQQFMKEYHRIKSRPK